MDAAAAASAAGVSAERLEEVAGWMAEAASVALPGATAGAGGAALAVATLVLNEVAGAVGKTVRFDGGRAGDSFHAYADVTSLLADCAAGKVGVLFLDGIDPIYLLPAGAGASDALAKVGQVVAFANESNDSLVSGALALPPGSSVEAWGDSSLWDGVYTLQQPAMRPLHDTRGIGDVLLASPRPPAWPPRPPRTTRTPRTSRPPSAPTVRPLPPPSRSPASTPRTTAPTRPPQKAVVWDRAGRPGSFEAFWTESVSAAAPG